MATVLVPWRGGCSYRLAALDWVLGKWIEIGYSAGCGLELQQSASGAWSKGDAINKGARWRDDAEILVVADADCWTDGIAAAVAAVEAGADWAVPHKTVHRLTEQSTAYLLAGCKEPLALETEECEVNGDGPYNGMHGGGIVVVRRDVLLGIPFDERFEGWGGEDASWRDAMLTLVGAPWCGQDPLFHLWHPPQPRISRKVGSRENAALRTRYVRANRKPKQMRALLAEIEEIHA